MFFKKKVNYLETIHDGAIGINETMNDVAVDMKKRFVGHRFLKQAKNRVSDWSLKRNAIAG